MNKFVAFGLGAAAVVVALIVGSQLLLPPSPRVGTGPTATPSPTSSPTPTPTLTPSPSTAAGVPLGQFILSDGVGEQNAVPMSVTVSAPGWFGDPGSGTLVKNGNADPPGGSGIIVFADGHPWFVPKDGCHWKSTIPDKPAATVDELVAALGAQASRAASAPSDITVDEQAGKSITLHVPDGLDLSTCDQGKFCTLADPQLAPADPCFRYHQGPGQIDEFVIVDTNGVGADGGVAILDAAHYAGTPPGDVAELDAIVGSLLFRAAGISN